jgi:adenosylcobinamide-phosphate synthase
MSARAAGIAAGAVLDAAIGDPRRGHPVAGFGRVAAGLERRVWAPRRTVGAAYAGALVAGAALGAGLAERLAPRRATLALVLWSTLGGRSLAREGLRLAALVERGDLEGARRRLPSLAGRDPEGLDGIELCRAAIESVAENTADAVVGPLVWCAVAGAPGAAGYRAANTLDAMVGHRTERHERFGWAAARLDDLATWPAARLGARLACALAPVAGGDPTRALAVLRRDGAAHPSPNAGRMEAAFAGALGVRLGGALSYGGRVEERPELGAEGRAPGPADVRRAVRLSLAIGAAAAALAAAASR